MKKSKKSSIFTVYELEILNNQDSNIIGLMYEQKAIEKILNELNFNNTAK